jgi:hypothetical protein
MVTNKIGQARSPSGVTAAPGRLKATLRSLRVFIALPVVVAAISGSALVCGPTGSASATPVYMTAHTPDWTGSAGWGSRFPGWTIDNQGVIHLQGAFRQVSMSAPNPNLLGWTGWPGNQNAGAPDRNVYTVVHTGSGTYADLVIKPSGEIWLMPSPNTNPAFVSLEGISYTECTAPAEIASTPFR